MPTRKTAKKATAKKKAAPKKAEAEEYFQPLVALYEVPGKKKGQKVRLLLTPEQAEETKGAERVETE